jgi:hypothetical protein
MTRQVRMLAKSPQPGGARIRAPLVHAGHWPSMGSIKRSLTDCAGPEKTVTIRASDPGTSMAAYAWWMPTR